MSKKNGKSRDRRASSEPSNDSAQSAPSGGETTTRKKLTVPERLVAKSATIYDLVKDVGKMQIFYGVSADLAQSTANLLVEVDVWRGKIKEIVDGGWQPTVRGELKDLKEGDKVSIAAESKDDYSYIPQETLLAVSKIERSENGRIKRVLLVDERAFGSENPPEFVPTTYGWALLSHLERR